MIQSFFMQESKSLIPELAWTIDNYSNPDNTGTVYSEGGGSPDSYETGMRYPSYMVFIRSSDWDFAEWSALQVFEYFHKMHDRNITIVKTINGQEVTKNYYLHLIEALSEPLRIGVDDASLMQWSVNFRATLREVS